MTRSPHHHADDAGAVREHQLARAFVDLTDTMTDGFDLGGFLHVLVGHCVHLLGVDAAGVLVPDRPRGVRLTVASSEKARLLQQFSTDTDSGPGIDCLRTGRPVTSTDLTTEPRRWPRFTVAAELCGFQAVHALPMRLRHDIVGALSLLHTEPRHSHPTSAQLGRAFAAVATAAILRQRSIDHAEALSAQLRTALDTRVTIEQAKGMLAVHSGTLTPEQAFAALRGYARAHHHRLAEVARDIVDRTADVDAITTHGTH